MTGVNHDVSVLIPVHNGAATVARAIHSAAQQHPLEVVVLDDASTDDTPAIVLELAARYPCVRLQRNETKAANWQQAAAAVYSTLRGSHVIGMGADDALCEGVVASAQRHSEHAVVFHDYATADTLGNVIGAVQVSDGYIATLSPLEVRHRLRTRTYASETGIGSAVRVQHIAWLNSLSWWDMGPWADAIGFAAVAALHGAAYVPMPGAVFTVNSAGYGETHRTGPDASQYHRAVQSFLDACGVGFSVAVAIAHKRNVPYG